MPVKKERNRNALFKISMTALVKLAILNMLSTEKLYGHKIIEGISSMLDDKWAPSPGMIYPLLRQLEEDGHIIGWWSDPIKRSTRYYKITEEGSGYLTILKKNYQGQINDSIKILETFKECIYR